MHSSESTKEDSGDVDLVRGTVGFPSRDLGAQKNIFSTERCRSAYTLYHMVTV